MPCQATPRPNFWQASAATTHCWLVQQVSCWSCALRSASGTGDANTASVAWFTGVLVRASRNIKPDIRFGLPPPCCLLQSSQIQSNYKLAIHTRMIWEHSSDTATPESGRTIGSETHSWIGMRRIVASQMTNVGSIACRRLSDGQVAASSWTSSFREASCLRFQIQSALVLPLSFGHMWRSYSASSARLPEASGITQ